MEVYVNIDDLAAAVTQSVHLTGDHGSRWSTPTQQSRLTVDCTENLTGDHDR